MVPSGMPDETHADADRVLWGTVNAVVCVSRPRWRIKSRLITNKNTQFTILSFLWLWSGSLATDAKWFGEHLKIQLNPIRLKECDVLVSEDKLHLTTDKHSTIEERMIRTPRKNWTYLRSRLVWQLINLLRLHDEQWWLVSHARYFTFHVYAQSNTPTNELVGKLYSPRSDERNALRWSC